LSPTEDSSFGEYIGIGSSTFTSLSTPDSDLTSTSVTEGVGGGSKRSGGLFCFQGKELDLRGLCVLCGFLIVAAALGIGVGIPIALELAGRKRAGAGGDPPPNPLRKFLTHSFLIDGYLCVLIPESGKRILSLQLKISL
jgi:hypothetical protein